MSPVTIKILSWDKSEGWTRNQGHARDSMVGMLRESTSIRQTEAKRLIRAVLSGQVSEIVVENISVALGIQNRLESLGASVEIVGRSI